MQWLNRVNRVIWMENAPQVNPYSITFYTCSQWEIHTSHHKTRAQRSQTITHNAGTFGQVWIIKITLWEPPFKKNNQFCFAVFNESNFPPWSEIDYILNQGRPWRGLVFLQLLSTSSTYHIPIERLLDPESRLGSRESNIIYRDDNTVS